MAFVEFEQRGHVGLITINRPEVLNALNLEVIEQLDDILLRAESQEDVHVIVITGAGRSFVAGARHRRDGQLYRRRRQALQPSWKQYHDAHHPLPQPGDRRSQRLRPGRRL